MPGWSCDRACRGRALPLIGSTYPFLGGRLPIRTRGVGVGNGRIETCPRCSNGREELDALRSALDRAAEGHGSTILVLGEAGIGKTSLVRTFISTVGTTARMLVGTGEDLLTPRASVRSGMPPGPPQVCPLARALDSPEEPDLIYSSICDELAAEPSPTVLVIEDAHWADGATLDAVRHLGRRVDDLPGLSFSRTATTCWAATTRSAASSPASVAAPSGWPWSR